MECCGMNEKHAGDCVYNIENVQKNFKNGVNSFFAGDTKQEKIQNMEQTNKEQIRTYIRSPHYLFLIVSEIQKQGFKVLRVYEKKEVPK